MKFFLYSIALCCAGIFVGCQEDEELNLLGYPENPVNVITPGESGDVSNMKVEATYNEEGKLVVSSALRRTWMVSLATPSPEDVVLQIAPYCVNIPVDKVELSETTIKIPAGSVSAPVTVGLKGDDFSFAEEDLTAQTYELGFNVVNAEGVNLKTESALGKITIEKEAYLVHVSTAGEDGNQVSMKRVCKDGQILGGPIEYTFTVQLDRPVKEDLSLSFATEGIPEDLKEYVTFTPAQLTIPAGEKSTETIKWSVSDEFLLANEEDAIYDIVLKPVFESSDIVSLDQENGNINITLNKTSSVLELVNNTQSNWAKLDKNLWSAELVGNWTGDPSKLFTNDSYFKGLEFKEENGPVGEIIVDLGKEETIAGFYAQYSYKYPGDFFTSPIKVELLTSTDKAEWTSIGSIDAPSSRGKHYINVVLPVKTRYIKYAATVDSNISYVNVRYMEFYGVK